MLKENSKIDLFYLAYLLFLSAGIIEISTIHSNTLINTLKIAGYIFICYMVYKKKQSLMCITLFLFLAPIFVLSSHISGVYFFFVLFLFIVATEKLNLHKLIQLDLLVRCFLMSVIGIMAYAGIIPNITYEDLNGIKTSQGFSHPNHLGSLFLVVFIYHFYLKHKRYRWYDYLISTFIFLLTLKITRSRTSIYLMIIIMIFEISDAVLSKLNKEFFKMRFLEKIKRGMVCGIRYLVFIIPLGSLYLAYRYNENNIFWRAVNSRLTGRLYLAKVAVENNPISLLGRYIEYQGGRDTAAVVELLNAVDNVYVYVFLHLGTIVFIIFLLSLWLVLNHTEKNDRTAFFCICFFMVAGFAESTMFDLIHNIFLLYLAPALIPDKISSKYLVRQWSE